MDGYECPECGGEMVDDEFNGKRCTDCGTTEFEIDEGLV